KLAGANAPSGQQVAQAASAEPKLLDRLFCHVAGVPLDLASDLKQTVDDFLTARLQHEAAVDQVIVGVHAKSPHAKRPIGIDELKNLTGVSKIDHRQPQVGFAVCHRTRRESRAARVKTSLDLAFGRLCVDQPHDLSEVVPVLFLSSYS